MNADEQLDYYCKFYGLKGAQRIKIEDDARMIFGKSVGSLSQHELMLVIEKYIE
tara:strand:+ start:1662 stop:1823 length:162 start_codon:yes stop_codon:yes gene_type:complete